MFFKKKNLAAAGDSLERIADQMIILEAMWANECLSPTDDHYAHCLLKIYTQLAIQGKAVQSVTGLTHPLIGNLNEGMLL